MKKFTNRVKFYIKDIDVNYIDEHAAGCAYYTILAFIPLLLLILTLTKYFEIDEEMFIYVLEGIIPGEILNEAIISIVKEVQSKSVGTITISAIITLWSAGRGFFALCKGLSNTYKVETENEYIKYKLKALITTIIFIIVVLISLVLLVFGNRTNMFLQERFNIIIELLLKVRIILSVIILSLILVIVYRFIPKHKYKFKNQIPGAIFAAIACNIVSIFYSIYVNLYTGFSFMYGSLTSIVLAMLWIYACMYSILLGAAINKAIIDNKRL